MTTPYNPRADWAAEAYLAAKEAFCTTCCTSYPLKTWPPSSEDLESAELIHRKIDGAHYAIWADDVRTYSCNWL